jgi:hypothetical protein
MKNGVFWDVTPCGSSKNRRFGGTYCLHHQVDNTILKYYSISSQLASVIPSTMILATLIMEAVNSSETSVLTRTTRRNIAKDGIL